VGPMLTCACPVWLSGCLVAGLWCRDLNVGSNDITGSIPAALSALSAITCVVLLLNLCHAIAPSVLTSPSSLVAGRSPWMGTSSQARCPAFSRSSSCGEGVVVASLCPLMTI
jgi:hypothetical protein